MRQFSPFFLCFYDFVVSRSSPQQNSKKQQNSKFQKKSSWSDINREINVLYYNVYVLNDNILLMRIFLIWRKKEEEKEENKKRRKKKKGRRRKRRRRRGGGGGGGRLWLAVFELKKIWVELFYWLVNRMVIENIVYITFMLYFGTIALLWAGSVSCTHYYTYK